MSWYYNLSFKVNTRAAIIVHNFSSRIRVLKFTFCSPKSDRSVHIPLSTHTSPDSFTPSSSILVPDTSALTSNTHPV